MKKIFFASLLILFTLPLLHAQTNNTVVLTVSGSGKTQEEAKLSALRLAIEQAFGAFISSKTDMLDDKVVSDQITSIANGNIQSFEVLNETQLPSGGWSMILKATVSVSKLTSFVQARGVAIEINGGLFVVNIKQQILNEQSEVKSMFDLVSILHENLQNAFDYEIENKTPIIINGDNNNWKIPLKVSAIANKNIVFCNDFLINTLKSISLKQDEVKTYKEMGKEVFTIYVGENFTPYYLRNRESLKIFNTILGLSNFYPSLFKYESGVKIDARIDYEVRCEGLSDYKKKYDSLQRAGLGRRNGENREMYTFLSELDQALSRNDKKAQLIILPNLKTTYATYSWNDTMNLVQLDKLTGYKVNPVGTISTIKDGGFLIEVKQGKKIIVSLYDQEQVAQDSVLKIITTPQFSTAKSIGGYNNWRVPTINELKAIDMQLHEKYNGFIFPSSQNYNSSYKQYWSSDLKNNSNQSNNNLRLFYFVNKQGKVISNYPRSNYTTRFVGNNSNNPYLQLTCHQDGASDQYFNRYAEVYLRLVKDYVSEPDSTMVNSDAVMTDSPSSDLNQYTGSYTLGETFTYFIQLKDGNLYFTIEYLSVKKTLVRLPSELMEKTDDDTFNLEKGGKITFVKDQLNQVVSLKYKPRKLSSAIEAKKD